MDRRIWEVDLNMIGSLTINENISFRQEKGFDLYQFYSDIVLEKSNSGIKATITAYAPNSGMAEMAAYVYFGRMTDVLSLDNELPIYLSMYEDSVRINSETYSRRRLEKSDFIKAFKMARKFELEAPKLLRAIGWYSKGKVSQNTLDKFLSYWNVIEIVGKEFHTETDRTKKGVKNQIYQCFNDYFGDISGWNLPQNWIDDMYEKRNKIVHGGEDTTVESINNVSKLLPLLEKTCHSLINNIIDSKYERIEFKHIDF